MLCLGLGVALGWGMGVGGHHLLEWAFLPTIGTHGPGAWAGKRGTCSPLSLLLALLVCPLQPGLRMGCQTSAHSICISSCLYSVPGCLGLESPGGGPVQGVGGVLITPSLHMDCVVSPQNPSTWEVEGGWRRSQFIAPSCLFSLLAGLGHFS